MKVYIVYKDNHVEVHMCESYYYNWEGCLRLKGVPDRGTLMIPIEVIWNWSIWEGERK